MDCSFSKDGATVCAYKLNNARCVLFLVYSKRSNIDFLMFYIGTPHLNLKKKTYILYTIDYDIPGSIEGKKSFFKFRWGVPMMF